MKLLIALILTTVISTTLSAQSTEFKYQGHLLDNAVPANGNYDFQFRLWSSETGGGGFGVETRLNVPVSNGVFTVDLDFGNLFTGPERWLGISIRPSGTSDQYLELTGRKRIATTPYAIKSLNADTATNSSQLGGVPASQYVVTTDPRMSDPRTPLPGSNSYIQNQGGTPQAGSFSITGNAVSGAVAVGNGSAVLPSIAFSGDTNTGIFRPAADTLEFATNGVSRMQIGPTGNVNLSGTLTLPVSTRYYSVSPSAFQSANSDQKYENINRLFGSVVNEIVTFRAPVNLPHGATITEVRVVFLDNSSENITYGLVRNGQLAPGGQYLAEGTSAGANPTVQTFVFPFIVFPIVDNQNFHYEVRADWRVPATPINNYIVSFRITYTVTAPLP